MVASSNEHNNCANRVLAAAKIEPFLKEHNIPFRVRSTVVSADNGFDEDNYLTISIPYVTNVELALAEVERWKEGIPMFAVLLTKPVAINAEVELLREKIENLGCGEYAIHAYRMSGIAVVYNREMFTFSTPTNGQESLFDNTWHMYQRDLSRHIGIQMQFTLESLYKLPSIHKSLEAFDISHSVNIPAYNEAYKVSKSFNSAYIYDCGKDSNAAITIEYDNTESANYYNPKFNEMIASLKKYPYFVLYDEANNEGAHIFIELSKKLSAEEEEYLYTAVLMLNLIIGKKGIGIHVSFSPSTREYANRLLDIINGNP